FGAGLIGFGLQTLKDIFIRPAMSRDQLLRRYEKPRRLSYLVSDFQIAHQARVHTEQVEWLSDCLRDFVRDARQLDCIQRVSGAVVEEDRAFAWFLGFQQRA